MEIIDTVRINFNQDQLFILNICLAFLMFGVALDLRLESFQFLFKRPKSLLTGFSAQLILLPLLTLLLIFIFQPPPSMALGMILVAACPGGNVSNFAVHLAGGNAALSVFMTTVVTLGAVITTPLYFTSLSPLIPGTEELRQSIQVSGLDMVFTIFQLILIPLGLGMWVSTRFPSFTSRIKVPVRRISILIFLAFIVVAVYGNFEVIAQYLYLVFLIVLVHNGLALALGYGLAHLNRLPQEDARAISLETGIQNSGLALILIFNFFDGLGGMAIIAAWWGIWHLVSAFSLAIWWRRGSL